MSEQKLRHKIRSLIKEEAEEEEVIQGEEHDEEEDPEERVGVENAESGNQYKVRRSFAFENPQRYNKIREAVRSTIKDVLHEAGAQTNMFGTSAKGNPREAIRKADRFEIHTEMPEDFGKHFESYDLKEIVEWLEGHARRGSSADEYEVTAYQGRTVLEVIPGQKFLQLARNTDLTARP